LHYDADYDRIAEITVSHRMDRRARLAVNVSHLPS